VLRRLGPLSVEDAVRIVSQLAGALDAAHARGLVHRDVKPSNVLLEDDLSHAYLTDFGIARAAGATAALTSVGMFVGTPDYAAPEQIAGGEIDGRVDIYALGALLYQALTGHLPYEREDLLAKLNAHAEAPPPRVSDVAPALASFDSVIARAMAKLPGDRPQTASELAAEAQDAMLAASAE
jgi:serine/threonine-protein kinase